MSKPTIDEILKRAMSARGNSPDMINDFAKTEAKQQLTQLIADIIGQDEPLHDANGHPNADYSPSQNQLRTEQRQRAKERGIDL